MTDATAGAIPAAGPGTAPHAAPPAHPDDGIRLRTPNRALLIVGAMAAMVMQVLDTTIANVALPHMQASLGATTETITWVLTSYVLASAIALPATGWLVQRIGLRAVFVGSVLAFTGASVLCGMAQSMEAIVAFRILQGLAGAFLAPLAQTVVLDASAPEEHGRMMIVYSQGVLLGPIIGPLLGGYITESFSWRWVFLINVPIGIVTALILFAMLPSDRGRKAHFDMFGWGLLAVAVGAFQLILDRGHGEDWFESGEIVAYAVLSAAAAWMVVVHLRSSPRAILPRELFADRNLVVCAILSFAFGMVMMSVMALLPGLLQGIYGYTTIDAGWLLIPRGFAMLLTMSLLGKVIMKLDPRLSIATGLIVTGGSMWMMTTWSTDMPATPIVIAGAVQGLAFGFLFLPLNILAFMTLPGELRTHASSFLTLVRNVGQSIGIALCTVLLARNIQINHAELGARLTQDRTPLNIDQLGLGGISGEGAMRLVDGLVTRQAAMIAYLDDFWFMALVCWAAVPLVLFTQTRRAVVAPPTEIPH